MFDVTAFNEDEILVRARSNQFPPSESTFLNINCYPMNEVSQVMNEKCQ